MKASILGYGAYVPQYRIKISEIAGVWGKNSIEIEKSLKVGEKSVSATDEDAVTLAYEASLSALKRANVNPSDIGVCFVGSESHPYAVNPTSTIVAEFLGMGSNYLAADLEFACKAATTGMIAVSSMIESGRINIGLCIGTDRAQSKPHDILEYTAASASAAFIIGESKEESIAEIVDYTSYSSDTPDFWRRDGIQYPSHGGRFTGEPSYFAHVEAASKNLLSKLHLQPKDFDYCVFHMPNGKFPREVGKRLGFSDGQLLPSLTVDLIGNPYSASSLLGLSSVLDTAKPGQMIFMTSYGSGAGSDSFVFKTGKGVSRRNSVPTFNELMEKKKYISYVEYLKFSRKI